MSQADHSAPPRVTHLRYCSQQFLPTAHNRSLGRDWPTAGHSRKRSDFDLISTSTKSAQDFFHLCYQQGATATTAEMRMNPMD